MNFTTLQVSVQEHIAEVTLHRPKQGNAMSVAMFREISEAFDALDANDDVRVIILNAHGKNFTYGLDLMDAARELGPHFQGGLASKRKNLLKLIRRLQHETGGPARTAKPVVAAIQGWCIGGGVDLISACDIRLCSQDAKFSVREAQIGIVADLGSLQRLPRIIGDAATRELALTAKNIDSTRALSLGLVSQIHPTHEDLLTAARAEAQIIADLSPLVVQGVKEVLNACDSKPIPQGLEHVALWNSAFLASQDLGEAMSAFMEKRKPKYTGK